LLPPNQGKFVMQFDCQIEQNLLPPIEHSIAVVYERQQISSQIIKIKDELFVFVPFLTIKQDIFVYFNSVCNKNRF
jgi:hypothetical protein